MCSMPFSLQFNNDGVNGLRFLTDQTILALRPSPPSILIRSIFLRLSAPDPFSPSSFSPQPETLAAAGVTCRPWASRGVDAARTRPLGGRPQSRCCTHVPPKAGGRKAKTQRARAPSGGRAQEQTASLVPTHAPSPGRRGHRHRSSMNGFLKGELLLLILF
jgi:hypothetical protein